MSIRVAVLAASGKTGQQLVRQALERGHHVTAVARNISRIPFQATESLRLVAGDVREPDSIQAAVRDSDVILSALGAVPGDPDGLLSAGAAALSGSGKPIVWLGAFGTGDSAAAAGAVTRAILKVALRGELADKQTADGMILAMAGTVIHVGPLTNGRRRFGRRYLLPTLPRQLLATPISRATVAAAMLDEAETPPRSGQLVVAISRRRTAGR